MRANCNLVCCLLALVCLSIFLIGLNSFVEHHAERSCKESARTVPPPLEKKTVSTSSERTNICFLKTHKCASSTIQNILMRFGYLRHLNFVLPEKANYLGHPAKFSRSMIPPQLQTPAKKYNILTHHTRYNHKEMKAVMENSTAFVTILRNPADVYEAMYSYYRFDQANNMTLQQAIRKKPKSMFHSSKGNRFTLNQMSYDLGFDVDSKNHSAIVEFIQQIDAEFDLVMISEHMEASLVLLCELMNWPLENVVHFKTNSRSALRKTVLTPSERAMLTRYSSIDAELYRYFINRFKSSVIAYGVDKMKQQVSKLIALNSELWQRCVDKVSLKGYATTVSYDLRNAQDVLCFYSAKAELAFTDEIRSDQMKRLAALKKLDELMTTST